MENIYGDVGGSRVINKSFPLILDQQLYFLKGRIYKHDATYAKQYVPLRMHTVLLLEDQIFKLKKTELM
jgi:hypothetical protein